eukprot:Pgem_evm1s3869
MKEGKTSKKKTEKSKKSKKLGKKSKKIKREKEIFENSLSRDAVKFDITTTQSNLPDIDTEPSDSSDYDSRASSKLIETQNKNISTSCDNSDTEPSDSSEDEEEYAREFSTRQSHSSGLPINTNNVFQNSTAQLKYLKENSFTSKEIWLQFLESTSGIWKLSYCMSSSEKENRFKFKAGDKKSKCACMRYDLERNNCNCDHDICFHFLLFEKNDHFSKEFKY